MKKLGFLALAVLFASGSAFATDVGSNFNVSIGFTGSCKLLQGASDLSFTYAAFAGGTSQNTTAKFQCSRGLTPISFRFDDNGSDQTGGGGVNKDTLIKGEGVIAGIRYTLTGTTTKTDGTAASAGSGGTGGSNGTADVYSVNIVADIPGGQAGDGATGSGTHARTLYITY